MAKTNIHCEEDQSIQKILSGLPDLQEKGSGENRQRVLAVIKKNFILSESIPEDRKRSTFVHVPSFYWCGGLGRPLFFCIFARYFEGWQRVVAGYSFLEGVISIERHNGKELKGPYFTAFEIY